MGSLRHFLYLSCILFVSILCADGLFDAEQLASHLAEVRRINKAINDTLPVIYNHSLDVGYLNMPSARMDTVGTIALGATHVPPYNNYSINVQAFQRIDFSANYRIFYGLPEYHMAQYGFGDDADRGVNVKVALLTRKDGFEYLPEISVGAEDFYGSKRFESYYVVATKEILAWNLEASFGWGIKRIKGPFGGVIWSPLRNSSNFLLKGFSFIAEYDAIDYENHDAEHDFGRDIRSRVNAGVALTLFDILQMRVASQRGEKLAYSASLKYNFGQTKGLFPKIDNPKPYKKPINTEPLGALRLPKELGQEMAYAFQKQGLTLSKIKLVQDQGKGKSLWIQLLNIRYREECDLRRRIEDILAAMTPSNIAKVIVVIEVNGIPTQSYTFRTQDLKAFRERSISSYELQILSPIENVPSEPDRFDSTLLYERRKSPWIVTFRPRLLTFFGSSRGKFKYSFGVTGGLNGYLWNQIYYEILTAFTIKASIYDMMDYDFYNPSQLINVRTDAINYFQADRFTINKAYLQKGWNWGKGYFGRVALGYFEAMYGGIAAEMLYYPLNKDWAIGLEGAGVLKRKTGGLGFVTRVRKLNGFTPTYVHFIGYQYFLDLYYRFKPANLDFSVKIGSFLARDKGARFDVSRTYPSGMRLGLWYTLTNADDFVNGHRYHDTGVSIFLPLDIFLTKSSRSFFGYAMSFWLRDSGAFALTGKQLYPTINNERRGYVYNLY